MSAFRVYTRETENDNFSFLLSFFCCCRWKDLEPGIQPSYISELLQDEDVGDSGYHSHEFWCDSQHLQLHVSSHFNVEMLVMVQVWTACYFPFEPGTLRRGTTCFWSSSLSCSSSCVCLATLCSWLRTSGWSFLRRTPDTLRASSFTS